MTAEDTGVTLPTVTLRNRRFDVRIDTGELVFPAIVLLFCAVYYVDTRGLPSESMLYAGPLLYVTALLAVITIFGHAISIDTGTGGDLNGSSTESAGSVVWGVERVVAEREHPQKDTQSDASDSDETAERNAAETEPFFTVRSAIGLVLLTTGYLLALSVVPFVFATAPFLAATVYLFGERSYGRIVVYSVGFTTLLWFVFVLWLRVPLP